MSVDQQNVMLGRITTNVMVSALNGDKVPDWIVVPLRDLTKENIDKLDWSLSLPPPGWKP